MKILQWNVNGFYPRLESIQYLCNLTHPDILCIQETNFKDSKHGNIKGYNCSFKNRCNTNHASGGVAIYIKDHIPYQEVIIQSNIEVSAIRILSPVQINICNIYLPNSYKFAEQEVTDIINKMQKPFLIMGDFNSHNRIWGSNKTDSRGIMLEEIFDKLDTIVLNTGEPTHINTSNNSYSAIDISISSTQYSYKCSWNILDYPYDSDHFPIFININNTPNTHNQDQAIPRRNYNKANWNLYNNLIKKYLPKINDLLETENIDTIINSFNDVITKAANGSTETINLAKKPKLVHWWNEKCKLALKNSKHAFNKYKKHNTEENKIQYKKMRAVTRRTIKESKANTWRNYVSSLSIHNNINESWAKIKAIEGTKKGKQIHFLLSNNQIITDHNEIANSIACSFAKNSSSKNYTEAFLQHKKEQENLTEPTNNQDLATYYHINDPIGIQELNSAINRTRNSSPGPDNIPYILLKNLPLEGKEILLRIYNIIWNKNVFPELWRSAIVIPIPKPGKDPTKTENYRPISLTCNMCKILEKIINKRLRWFLDFKNIISNNQFGFRAGHSTTSHLVSIDNYIQEALANKQHVLAVSLDIEKAYDMVWTHIIMTKLQEYGLKGNIFQFIKNFTKERTFNVRVNGSLSSVQHLENGLPQGAVLSVTLFLLAINDAGSEINHPVIIRKYADDITILCRGSSITTSQEIIQSALNNLLEWSLKSGFKFSASKTQCIVFSRQNMESQPTLKMDLHNLKFYQNIKILGMHFDSKMNWKRHIQILSEECKKRLNILKCISHNNWGADKHLQLMTYKAIIRSKIDYGSILYDSASKKDLQKLDVIHNKALRISTGCFQTSPIGSILIEAKEPTLAHRRQMLTLKYAIKSAESNNPIIYHDIYPKLQNYYKEQKCFSPVYTKVKNLLRQLNLQEHILMEKETIVYHRGQFLK